jgi:hypothetical protein
MNSIPGENRELDALVNQPKETHKRGHIHGTDFRHAVEFSKSGRARTPAFSAFVRGGVPTVHRAPQRWDLGVLPAVSQACGPVRSRSVRREEYTSLQAAAGGSPGGSRSWSRTGRRTPASSTGPSAAAIVGTVATRPRGRSGRRTTPRCAVRPRHAHGSRWHTAVPSVRRHRGAGTGRSPAVPPVGPSWGCSAPTCAGTTRP